MKLLITAGPTREPIDPVRFIGNRSSGRVGLAIAQTACEQGHDVHLLLGPITQPVDLPEAVKVSRYNATADLNQALKTHFPQCDCLVMAAAVADYTPQTTHTGKLPRKADGSLTLTLVPTPDLVAGICQHKQPHQRVIAFALEEQAILMQRAREKMQRKKVDAIVANPLQTMDADTIQPTWITANHLADGQGDDLGDHLGDGLQNDSQEGQYESAQSMSKSDFAAWLLQRIVKLMPDTASL